MKITLSQEEVYVNAASALAQRNSNGQVQVSWKPQDDGSVEFYIVDLSTVSPVNTTASTQSETVQ